MTVYFLRKFDEILRCWPGFCTKHEINFRAALVPPLPFRNWNIEEPLLNTAQSLLFSNAFGNKVYNY
jgi:hypothetical protein